MLCNVIHLFQHFLCRVPVFLVPWQVAGVISMNWSWDQLFLYTMMVLNNEMSPRKKHVNKTCQFELSFGALCICLLAQSWNKNLGEALFACWICYQDWNLNMSRTNMVKSVSCWAIQSSKCLRYEAMFPIQARMYCMRMNTIVHSFQSKQHHFVRRPRCWLENHPLVSGVLVT